MPNAPAREMSPATPTPLSRTTRISRSPARASGVSRCAVSGAAAAGRRQAVPQRVLDQRLQQEGRHAAPARCRARRPSSTTADRRSASPRRPGRRSSARSRSSSVVSASRSRASDARSRSPSRVSIRPAVTGSCCVSTEMFCRLLNRKCGCSRIRSASSSAWRRLVASCAFSSISRAARRSFSRASISVRSAVAARDRRPVEQLVPEQIARRHQPAQRHRMRRAAGGGLDQRAQAPPSSATRRRPSAR